MATELCDRCLIGGVCDVKDIIEQPPQCKNFVERPKTRCDELHSMNAEELADFIMSVEPTACPFRSDHGDDCQFTNCRDCWIQWLSEVCVNEK